MEPNRRRLEQEFGDRVRIAYVMGGLARSFGAPERQVGEWLEAADRSGMPVDPRLWLESPPASSYPACLAVVAAAEQGDPGPYLRRLREGLLCGRRKLDAVEALVAEARAVPGIDVERFRIDLGSSAIVERFGSDLERAREASAPGEERVELPTIAFAGADGTPHAVRGFAPYEAWRAGALAAGAEPSGAAAPGVEAALRTAGALATVEVAALCDLPGPRAAAELWRLALEWRVRAERRLTAELWSAT
ncbi:MAG: putative dithiol-disulfide isomerase involved in polyketide biosynthesis [Conexibacter sp.]|jgi:predicted DsbA family dithiol-disulfide isomerase|nr:putative dithiol-disulfide isomerase involved in polyketide biosynthesis [Conexibacter sp.]